MKIKKQLSRKQLRKSKKLQKKQRIQKYHQSRSHGAQQIPLSHNQKNVNVKAKNMSKNFEKIIKPQPIPSKKNVDKKSLKRTNQYEFNDEEDERIAMYEQKLGMKKGKKYGNLAKKMGFDDDLFSFLDDISKKVKNKNYTQEQNPEVQQEDQREDNLSYQQQIQDMGDDIDYQKMLDEALDGHENQISYESQQNQQKMDYNNKYKVKKQNKLIASKIENKKEIHIIEKKQKKQKKLLNEKQSKKNTKSDKNATKNPEKQLISKQEEKNPNNEQLEAQKKMNSLFNKLSDGNLLITFRQLINIFQSYPKSITINTFANLFVKFNLMIEKPLVHVMSANIVIAVSLHRVYGDKLMAQLLYELVQGFQKLEKTEQNLQQVQELGYSKVFEKKKNFVTIVSFLYEFASISSSFLQTLVFYLTQNIGNKEYIELIYLVVQKCGVRMRNNDPGTLKDVIQILKKLVSQSKLNGTYETTKIKFIDIEINQIRFNKKGLFDADQRMGFLHTFLSKTIKEQMPVEIRTLDVTFDQFKQVQNTFGPQWWAQDHQNHIESEKTQVSNIRNQTNQEVKALYELAKSLHFVTQIKRNIFVQLMSSNDYIEATKRLLDLKVKRLEDMATVIVEVNLQQNSFNPFYSLVACKIAEQIPKFRVCLQFAIWDRLKQLQNYQPRKISNLGKFTAWLISSEQANSSLTLLKYFPDLLNVRTEQDIFLRVFFKELFRKSKRAWINRLAHKLQEQKNKGIREGIKDYLGEIQQQFQKQKQRECSSLLRKLLTIQFQNEIENQ